MENATDYKLPKPFILRRLHSILGLWLVIYLFEHLLVNSQAALFFHDQGYGFISMVNKLEDIPYLPLIEIVFLGAPFLIHMIWGVLYLRKAKLNAHKTDGSKPHLPYKRNRAYSWQRITSILLIVFIVVHVIQMRFLDRPLVAFRGLEKQYMVKVHFDIGLYGVLDKLHGQLFKTAEVESRVKDLEEKKADFLEMKERNASYYHLKERIEEEEKWIKTASQRSLKESEVLVVTPNAGSAFFIMVRETFKSPIMVILYSIFVICASYHAFNGLWTLLITWGVTLTKRSQMRMRTVTNILMTITIIMGLVAAWGTYWTTQFQI